jgi:hypothetical protein
MKPILYHLSAVSIQFEPICRPNPQHSWMVNIGETKDRHVYLAKELSSAMFNVPVRFSSSVFNNNRTAIVAMTKEARLVFYNILKWLANRGRKKTNRMRPDGQPSVKGIIYC